MTEPYGHWGWTFWARTATAGSNCAQARSAMQYDLFLGDASKVSDANNQKLYTAQVGRRAAGWPAGWLPRAAASSAGRWRAEGCGCTFVRPAC